MRAPVLFLLALTVAAAAETSDDPFPKAMPLSRYTAMMDQSPFALATVTEAPKGPTESFTANWEIVGLARLRNTDGSDHDMVTIRSRDRRVSFTLHSGQVGTTEDSKGISLVSVDRVPEARKSTVILKRDNEEGTVAFGEESTPQIPQPQVQQQNAGMKGSRPSPNGPQGTYIPKPGVNPIKPNNAAMNQMRPNFPTQTLPQPNAAPPNLPIPGTVPASDDRNQRNRVRVINTR